MTYWMGKKLKLIATFSILLISALFTASVFQIARASQLASPDLADAAETQPENPLLSNNLYVPLMFADHPWDSPYGVESSSPLLESNTLLTRASKLQLGWARMGNQISWRDLQPTEGGDIQWDLLATFENELLGLKAEGIRPVVVIKDTPYWALDTEKAVKNGELTSCGAIAVEHFGDFAAFISQLVAKYKTDAFNVHDWELGNEPDVDPSLVERDNHFGCWGDEDDPYYGGRHYGEMLKVVAPAIRKADSRAQIWIGGLLLASPSSSLNNSMSELFTRGIIEAGAAPHSNSKLISGSPEQFFKGILVAGAAPDFDVVPYHWYPSYWDSASGPLRDYDNAGGSPWDAWGGGTVGKARYLRQVMADYSIQKTVFLNEAAFACSERNNDCLPPGLDFYDSQASHLVRFSIRGISEDVSGFIWYTLNGPGWRYTGLLDGSQQPKTVFNAYQQLSGILRFARYLYPVYDYNPSIEAYAFRSGTEQVHVLWSKKDQTNQFYVPTSKFIRAVSREGLVIYDQSSPPPQIGSDYLLEVGFSPIYIVRLP